MNFLRQENGSAMATHIDFYFDYLSPFAYLAWKKLPQVIASHELEIRPVPVLFAGLLNHWGQLGPAEIPPKALHIFKECARYAQIHGIPFRSPLHHPFKPLTALRCSLQEVSGPDQARVISAIFDAGWGQGKDLGDKQTIIKMLNDIGLDGEQLVSKTSQPEIKKALEANTLGATQGGVFGIPTMQVDDEIFWGLDQLPYLALFLDGNDPLKQVDLNKIVSKGPAAIRPGSLQRGIQSSPTDQ